MQGYKNDKDVPVLINDSLSPEILKVLLQIFHKFDKGQDGCLDPKELDLFVYSKNGQHPPTSFIEQMDQRFGANEKGWLTKKDIWYVLLCVYISRGSIILILEFYYYYVFYLEKTLGGPDKTRKDIRAHGYDGSKLKRFVNRRSPLRSFFIDTCDCTLIKNTFTYNTFTTHSHINAIKPHLSL